VVRVDVGTSGWQYRSWRQGAFYPKGLKASLELEEYASRFGCVEVNNTFYRLPEADVFAAWAARTPDDFRVVVKASRYLSHVRRLRDPEEPVARLLERARRLGPKLGPVLLQLPPTLGIDLDRLEATLAAFGPDVQVAFEPRHPSWFADAVYAVLARHDGALCLTDRRNRRGPVAFPARWTYVRLHEGTATPRPCYGRAALAGWVATLADAPAAVQRAWVFFNNDPEACAPANAATFGRLAGRAGLDVGRFPGGDER
jgi:uncharacterized protein YecE (DUF72 family)